jgi:hypothetical protein
MKVTETEMATVVLTDHEVDCMVREYLERHGRGDLFTCYIDDLTLNLRDPDQAMVIFMSKKKEEEKNV